MQTMNNALLIQHVSSNAPHINLLKVTAARHMEYCLAHHIDYQLSIGGEPYTKGDWDKVRMLQAALEMPYQYVIALDADCLIVDMHADIRNGCPPGKIGACRHFLKQAGCPPSHLNVGAVYVSNSEASRNFMARWLGLFPGTPSPMWWEQGAFNDLAGDEVEMIDDKWNSTAGVNLSPNPVVIGFHGQGDVKQRFALMRAALERTR